MPAGEVCAECGLQFPVKKNRAISRNFKWPISGGFLHRIISPGAAGEVALSVAILPSHPQVVHWKVVSREDGGQNVG